MGWLSKSKAAILKHDGVSCAEAAENLRKQGLCWREILEKSHAHVEESKRIIEQAMTDVYDTSTVAGAPSKERIIEHNRSSIKWNEGIRDYVKGETEISRHRYISAVKLALATKDTEPEKYHAAVNAAIDQGCTHMWVWDAKNNKRANVIHAGQVRLNLKTGLVDKTSGGGVDGVD
jgi:hypothetical protein